MGLVDMAAIYDLKQNQPDSHQMSTWWTMCVIRFSYIRTTDRKAIAQLTGRELDISLQAARKRPVEEIPAIILGSQILSWSVNQQKSSHTNTANFKLAPVARFDKLIHAGDWVFFWTHDSLADRDRVRKNMRSLVKGPVAEEGSDISCNGFRDGLRFVGRANAPKLSESIAPGTGARQSGYDLTAIGFSEFDSKIYYTQAHGAQAKGKEAAQSQVNRILSTEIDKAVTASAVPMDTESHAELWLDVFLGSGPGPQSKGLVPTDLDSSPDIIASLIQTPNDSFYIPKSAARLLGQPAAVFYKDILQRFIGIQTPGIVVPENNTPNAVVFIERGARLLGAYRPNVIDFGDTTIWQLLGRFANTPVNEMFTGLRWNGFGVVPTFVLRQSPYSSKYAANSLSSNGVIATAFIDLPRWKIHDSLLFDRRIGPSDSLRVNYVKVEGTDPVGTSQVSLQLVNENLAPPMADIVDIRRHGLRTKIIRTNADITGQIQNTGGHGRAFTVLMSDMSFNQHLKWNGQLVLTGIVEPVAVGDNIECGAIVYQIESRQDTGSIDGLGHKVWRTTLGVSSGISVETENPDNDDDIMPHEVLTETTAVGVEGGRLRGATGAQFAHVTADDRPGETLDFTETERPQEPL